MRELTPVGLSKDGRRLVLVSASGEEFAVTVDTRLRAALRGENARLGQLEMKMESALRPRDIQARIRAGESPEEVATAAQTTVDAIMGFATPVLAERAHIAATAQKASVRRRTNEASSSARTLGDCAAEFFARHSLHDEDVEWDSWRRQDGRWAVVASYAVDGKPRRAELTHDVQGRFVVADNDDARVLTGELDGRSSSPAASGSAPAARRLATVPASQDELPLGDDAIELVRDREEAAPAPEADVATADSADDSAPDEEPTVPVSPITPDPGVDTADADWMTVDGAAPVQEPTSPAEVATPPAPPASSEQDDVPAEPEEPAAEEAPSRSSRRKGRSSVPSWDEIMFGGGKD